VIPDGAAAHRCEEDGARTAPASAAGIGSVTNNLDRIAVGRHALQLAIRKESDVSSIRRPEWKIAAAGPETSCASVECRDRVQIEQSLPPATEVEAAAVLQPTNASLLPSGEIFGGPFLPAGSGKTPSGGSTETSNGERGTTICDKLKGMEFPDRNRALCYVAVL
jgi:hypothetical protein